MLLDGTIRRIIKTLLGDIDSATPISSAAAIATTSTLAVTGASTLTGGIVGTTPTRISNILIGGVARASIGTDGAHVAGKVYFSELWLPTNKTLTGIGFLNGTTVGTDKMIVGLYSSAGVLLANSALAGALGAGQDDFQQIAFTAAYAAVGPARYWIAIQCEGTTHQTQKIAAATYLNSTGSVAGSFGTMPATITPTTTTTADVGPIGYVY
jgi:hypothetical protein